MVIDEITEYITTFIVIWRNY